MIYLYDGSFEGLLTAIFDAWKDRDPVVSIVSRTGYVPSFLDQPREVKTDFDKFNRVYSSIEKKISAHAGRIIYRVWLSEDNRAADLILHFLKTGYRIGAAVTNYIQDPMINNAIELNKKVGREVHRFLGLMRFKEISKGIFYAGYEPDHNITVLVAPHFTERLASQPFIIHDKKRNICAVFDGKDLALSDEVPAIPDTGTETEDQYAALWKTFFKTVAIRERKNIRTQMQFMPKKYWKNLTEMQD